MLYFIFRIGAGVGVGVGVDQKPGVGVGVGVGTAPPRLRTPGLLHDFESDLDHQAPISRPLERHLFWSGR